MWSYTFFTCPFIQNKSIINYFKYIYNIIIFNNYKNLYFIIILNKHEIREKSIIYYLFNKHGILCVKIKIN